MIERKECMKRIGLWVGGTIDAWDFKTKKNLATQGGKREIKVKILQNLNIRKFF